MCHPFFRHYRKLSLPRLWKAEWIFTYNRAKWTFGLVLSQYLTSPKHKFRIKHWNNRVLHNRNPPFMVLNQYVPFNGCVWKQKLGKCEKWKRNKLYIFLYNIILFPNIMKFSPTKPSEPYNVVNLGMHCNWQWDEMTSNTPTETGRQWEHWAVKCSSAITR